MAKKAKKRTSSKGISRRARLVVLPLLVVIGAGAVILAIITIIVMPKASQGSQQGVGANGFRAYEEQNTTLGVGAVASKDNVATALGDKAKSVSDAEVSNVFNFDGNRGQTATYRFTRQDGVKASVYVDMMLFKNPAAMNEAHIYAGTGDAGKINGHPAYYMIAQTLGAEREYRLMVVNGLKAYKFVFVQPSRSITISEVSAVAVLKKIAAKSNL